MTPKKKILCQILFSKSSRVNLTSNLDANYQNQSYLAKHLMEFEYTFSKQACALFTVSNNCLSALLNWGILLSRV